MGHRGISTSMHVSAKSVTIFCALYAEYVRISTSLVVCIMMIQNNITPKRTWPDLIIIHGHYHLRCVPCTVDINIYYKSKTPKFLLYSNQTMM